MADLTSLANVKAWLGTVPPADDALLTRLITAGSSFLETYLSRTLLTTAYSQVLNGHGGPALTLGNYPITAISSLKIDGATIPASTGVLVAGYVFSDYRVMLRGGYLFSDGLQNVEISYTAGLAAVPAEIEQVCIELVAARYKSRDRIGIQSKGLGGEQIVFTKKDLADTAADTLAQYRKVVPVV